MGLRSELAKVWGVVAMLVVAATPLRSFAAVNAPSYSAESIVNSATQTVQFLAPNTMATIYGSNLAFTTHVVTTGDVNRSTLPTDLDGVTVYVAGRQANLFYVSPTQINLLIPYDLIAGPVSITVLRQALAGPTIKVQLTSTAPGLFPWVDNLAIAVHLDGSLLTAASPAKPGEIVILYAVGLGWTTPDTTSGRVPVSAAWIQARSQMRVLLNGVPLPTESLLYAGLAPGFVGLYQINLRLPTVLPHNPEIRLSIGAQMSPPSVLLATQ